jgi:hypothetical protein
MTDEEMKEEETFTVSIRRFERDGKCLAVIELRQPDLGSSLTGMSYCDDEEIINKAFYRAHSSVSREINNAGLPEMPRKR